jgi:integrase
MKRGLLQFGGNSVNVWIDIEDGEIRASSVKPKESVRFADFARKYETECVSQMKPASQASIKSVLGVLTGHFGARKLGEIGTEDIQRFITGRAGSPKTIRNQIGIFRMAWNKARAWGYVKTNPFEFLSMPRSPLTEARCLSVDEVRAIVQKTDGEFSTMLKICAELGCRGGELVALTTDNVNLDARTISIKRSAFQGVLQDPKTRSAVRTVSISSNLTAHLAQFFLTRQTPIRHDGTRCDVARQDENLLFSNRGKVWNNGEVVRRLKPVLGEGVGLHAFRHANISLMASLGVPLHIQKERIGHSSGDITARYTHSSPEDHKKYAEIIGQALGVCTENVLSRAMGAD